MLKDFEDQNVDQSRESILYRFLLYIMYFFFLCFSYTAYIVVYWGYIGFELEVNYVHFYSSLLVIAFFVFISPRVFDARSYLLNLTMTINLIPSLVLYALGGMRFGFAMVGWVALAVVFLVSALPMRRITAGSISSKKLLYLTSAFILIFLLSFLPFGGIRNFNLDINEVYNLRDEVSANLPSIFNYLTPIISKAVIPFAVAAALFYRKYTAAIVFSMTGILVFGFTTHKGAIFYPLMAVFIYFALKKSMSYSYILALIIGLICVSFFDVYMISENSTNGLFGLYSNFLVRRSIMVPSLLDYNYIEFFSENPWFFWSSSKLSLGLISQPYAVTAPYVIGEAFLGSLEAGANTGYIGSGFAQAGIWGTLLYAIGVGLVVAYINAQSRTIGLPLVAAIMTAPAVTMFSSTDFITLFLTHGMIVSLLLLSLIEPRRRHASNNSRAVGFADGSHVDNSIRR